MRFLFVVALIFFIASLHEYAFARSDGDKCGADWTPFKGFCYKLLHPDTGIAKTRNHTKAQAECALHGGGANLASIHSSNEHAWLINLIKSKASDGADNGYGYWIAMRFTVNRPAITSVRWVDGTEVVYGRPYFATPSMEPWDHGQPDLSTLPTENGEWCGLLWKPAGYRFHDNGCANLSYNLGAICKKPAT